MKVSSKFEEKIISRVCYQHDCYMFCTFIRVSVCNTTAHPESQNLRGWKGLLGLIESNPLPKHILYSRLHRNLKPFATAWQRYKFKACVAAISYLALHSSTTHHCDGSY